MNSPSTDGMARPLIVIFCEPDRHYLDELAPVIGGRQVARHAVAAPLEWEDDSTLSRYQDMDAVVVVSSYLIASGLVFSDSFRAFIDANCVVSVVVQECNWGGTPIIETPVLALPLSRDVCLSALAGERVTAAKTDMITPTYDHPEHLIVGERLAALCMLHGIAPENDLAAAIARVETPLSLAHGWVPGRIIANRFRLVSRSTGIGQFRSFRAWDLQENNEVWVQSLSMVTPYAQRTLDHLRDVSLAIARIVPAMSSALVPTVIVPISHEQGVAYRVTSFVRGVSLAEINADTHCRMTKLLRVRSIVRALSVMHENGVVHGFLSPARIRLHEQKQDDITFLGFGLHRHTFTQADLTYIAPELLSGNPQPTLAADVYAIAMLVCVALVGEEHGQRLVSDSLAVLSEAGLSPTLVDLLMRGIAFQPSNRPESAVSFIDAVFEDEKLLREFVVSPVTEQAPHARRDALLSLLSTSPDTRTARQLSDVQHALGDSEGAYGAALSAITLATTPMELSEAITHILEMLDEPRSKTVLASLAALPDSLQAVASCGRAMVLDRWGPVEARVEAWSHAFACHQTRGQADRSLRGIGVATKELGATAAFIAWSELRLPFTHGSTRGELLVELAVAKGNLNQVKGCVEAACLAIEQGASFEKVVPSLQALPIHECWRALVDPLLSWAPVDTTGVTVPLLSTVASVARLSQSSQAAALHKALVAAQPDSAYALEYLVWDAFEREANSEVLALVSSSNQTHTPRILAFNIAALVSTDEVELAREALEAALEQFPANCMILELATDFALSRGETDHAFGYAQRRVAARSDAGAHTLLADVSLWCGLTAHAARNYQRAQECTPNLDRVTWGVSKVASFSVEEKPTPWYAISPPPRSPALNVAQWLSQRVAISSLLALVSQDVLGLNGQQKHKDLSRLAVATMVVELHCRRGTLMDGLYPLLCENFSDCAEELGADIVWAASRLQGQSKLTKRMWTTGVRMSFDSVVLNPRLSLVDAQPSVVQRPDAPMPPTTSKTCRIQISTGEVRAIDSAILVGGGEEDDWQIDSLPPRAFRLAYCGGMLYATAENSVLHQDGAAHQELCVTLAQRFVVETVSFSVRAPALNVEMPTVEPPQALEPKQEGLANDKVKAAENGVESEENNCQIHYQAALVIEDGSLLGEHYTLTEQRVQIGTALSSDLVLTDETVSPVHCVLVEQDGVWNIEDRAGSGSTRVNDRAVVFHKLEPGDHITIGLVEIEFHLVAIPETGREISFHDPFLE